MISQMIWNFGRLAIICLVTIVIALSLAVGVEAAPEKDFVSSNFADIIVLDESGETAIDLACTSYDFINDGIIDLDDINAVLNHSIFAGAPYDPQYDLSPDGVVDIADIFEVALHFGEPCPVVNIDIEVDDGTGFRSLDYALVGATEPTLRISGDLPPGFRVFNTRTDGRAGLDGGGREITVEFTETTPGVWEATLPMLIGQNTIVVTDVGGGDAQASATMFNYNLVFEDVNGNGLLDTGEDLDHDSELDVGEDQNGNGELDLSEDVNDNGVLDIGEDFNGNQLLDFNEDLNGDGLLNVDEDFNDNGVLDEGEDWNANDEIDGLSLGVIANYDDDPADYAMIPGPELFYSTIVIDLDAVDTATDVALSDLLRGYELRPIGIVVDNTIETKAKLFTVTLPVGADALEMVKTLNGLPIAGFDFAPPLASLPVGDPLEVAVLILAGAEPPQAAGEALPAATHQWRDRAAKRW